MSENKYSGPYWAFISDITGMPLEIQKCRFAPTINPRPNGTWVELYRRGAADYLPSRMEQLTAVLQGHMEAMRPLLEEWGKLKKEAEASQ